MMAPWVNRLRRFARQTRANAAIEFALLTPILLVLISGTVDLGLGFQQKLQLQSALNSGMQHVMQTQGQDIATTRKVIAYGLGVGSPAEVEVDTFCRCQSSPDCIKACAPGLDRYTTARISMPYKTAFFEFSLELDSQFEVYVGRVK